MWNGVAQWFGIIDAADLDYVLPNRRNFGCRLLTDADLYRDGTQTNFGCGGDTLNFNQVLLLKDARYLIGEEQRAICDLMINVALDAELDAKPLPTFNCVILKQRIEIFVNDSQENCTFKLHIKTELSSSATGIGTAVTAEMNNRMSEIVDTLTNDEIVESICGMEETEVLTPVPSSVPSQSPSAPAPTTPTWKRIFKVIFDKGWGQFKSGGRNAVINYKVGYGASNKSLMLLGRGRSAQGERNHL